MAGPRGWGPSGPGRFGLGRRAVLAGMGASLALPRGGWAEATAPRAAGELTVRVLCDGERTLPLATLYADVPRADLDAAHAAAAQGAAPDDLPTPAAAPSRRPTGKTACRPGETGEHMAIGSGDARA